MESPATGGSPQRVILTGRIARWPDGRRQAIADSDEETVDRAVETPSGLLYVLRTPAGSRLELLTEGSAPRVFARGAELEMVAAADGRKVAYRTLRSGTVVVALIADGSVVRRIDVGPALAAAKRRGAADVQLVGLTPTALFLGSASEDAPGPPLRVELATGRVLVSGLRTPLGRWLAAVEVSADGRRVVVADEERVCMEVLAEDLARVIAKRCDVQGAASPPDGVTMEGDRIAVSESSPAGPLALADATTLRTVHRWPLEPSGTPIDTAWEGTDLLVLFRKNPPNGPDDVPMPVWVLRCSPTRTTCERAMDLGLVQDLARIVPRRGF